jgi:hypothetical protein
MKALPIGTQTFEGIVTGNYVYVDKTRHIYDMAMVGSESPTASGPKFFLSRPRRFGKSLTISTLDALFSGRRELFEGLWIYENTDYAFEPFPVLRFDMSNMGKETGDELRSSLHKRMEQIAKKYGVVLDPELAIGQQFSELIQAVAATSQNRVVVLVDEYDAPFIRHISDAKKAGDNRVVLWDFYTTLKAEDAHLRFVLLTGVSKFSKVSVFSGLNNLRDLTMDVQYAGMLGYTQEELESNFNDHIEALAQKEERTLSETLDKIKYWYNGYRFSKAQVSVYNPFSTLLLFQQKDFKAYWFETGTPKFLIDLILAQQYEVQGLANVTVTETTFSTYELDTLSVLALLFQTGYLTILDYNKADNLFTLGYPNEEVRRAFTEALVSRYAVVEQGLSEAHVVRMIKALKKDDLEMFFDTLRIFFANIPYTIQLKNEKYYQTIFYLIFTLMGMRIQAEVTTSKGRIDAVLETAKEIYIFEFKLQGTAEEALAQIQSKGYAQKYGHLIHADPSVAKKVTLIGVEFDSEERNIGRWVQATA